MRRIHDGDKEKSGTSISEKATNQMLDAFFLSCTHLMTQGDGVQINDIFS